MEKVYRSLFGLLCNYNGISPSGARALYPLPAPARFPLERNITKRTRSRKDVVFHCVARTHLLEIALRPKREQRHAPTKRQATLALFFIPTERSYMGAQTLTEAPRGSLVGNGS